MKKPAFRQVKRPTAAARAWRCLLKLIPKVTFQTKRNAQVSNATNFGPTHSHKVPGSTGSRNGVEGRGTSLYKIVVRRGYISMER